MGGYDASKDVYPLSCVQAEIAKIIQPQRCVCMVVCEDNSVNSSDAMRDKAIEGCIPV